MLLFRSSLRDFALRGAFPYEVELRPLELTIDDDGNIEGDLPQVIRWCTERFGRPANQYVEEGFRDTFKVYQELAWLWDPTGNGRLFFDDANNAVLAKLTWG